MVAAPFNILNERARELLAARTSLAAYAIAQNPDYELASHLQILIDHLEALERGEIKNLMVFMPPRHGKEIGNSTPILTADRGWTTHGELRVGDRVFHPDGRPISVLAVIEQPEPCTLEVETFDGAVIKVHPRHEWTLWDRAQGKLRTLESRDLVSRDISTKAVLLKTGRIHRAFMPEAISKPVCLTSGILGKRGHRARFMLPLRKPLEFPEQEFSIAPYILGAWLGDGSSAAGVITHDAGDLEVAIAVGQDFERTAVRAHKTTGVLISRFRGLAPQLHRIGVLNNKHIPYSYQRGSIGQRLELLAGLIDTDGCVHRRTRRVCFSNCNKTLIDDVAELVRSFGWRATVTRYIARKSSSGIQGKQAVYQVTFSPDLDIPTKLPRKMIQGFKPIRRRIGIKAVRPCTPEPGRCITVDSPDGLYLVGRELTPTHNSETCTKLFPSWYLGRHPERLVILSSYSQELVEDFAQDCRDFIRSEFHSTVFPECVIDESVSARHDFRTTRKGGVRSVGKGGSITGRGGDLIVLDDIVKDKQEATSEAEQRKIRQWFSTTIIQRRSPITRMLLIMTRWDPEDVAGWQLDTYAKGWKVLELPAIAERDEGWRKEGEALWPERFDIDWLEDQREQMPRDDWLALYQQRPTRDGDERVFLDDWFQIFTPRKDLADAKLMNGEMIVDPAGSKRKKSDRTAIWVIGMAADRNYYFFDGVCDRLGLKERWETLKALHKKWAPNFRRLRTWYEEFGLMADREYITEKQNSEGYRFYVERIGDTHVPKPVLIRNFGRGVCQDKRVFFNKSIPRTIEGVRVNLTEWFYDHEWKRYPALRHEDCLNAAAYITDPKIGQGFPTGKKEGSVAEMLSQWKKRQERISPYGA